LANGTAAQTSKALITSRLFMVCPPSVPHFASHRRGISGAFT
jgi:hypothetical protein